MTNHQAAAQQESTAFQQQQNKSTRDGGAAIHQVLIAGSAATTLAQDNQATSALGLTSTAKSAFGASVAAPKSTASAAAQGGSEHAEEENSWPGHNNEASCGLKQRTPNQSTPLSISSSTIGSSELMQEQGKSEQQVALNSGQRSPSPQPHTDQPQARVAVLGQESSQEEDTVVTKPSAQVHDVAPVTDTDASTLQKIPSPQKGELEVEPSAETHCTLTAENPTTPPECNSKIKSPAEIRRSSAKKEDEPVVSKPYAQVLPETDIDTFQLQQTPSPQKGESEVEPTSDCYPSADNNHTATAENATALPASVGPSPASVDLSETDKPTDSESMKEQSEVRKKRSSEEVTSSDTGSKQDTHRNKKSKTEDPQAVSNQYDNQQDPLSTATQPGQQGSQNEPDVKLSAEANDEAPDIDSFQLQQTPSPQKGESEVNPTTDAEPSTEKHCTSAENPTAPTDDVAAPTKEKQTISEAGSTLTASKKKSPAKKKSPKKSPAKRRRSSAKKEPLESRIPTELESAKEDVGKTEDQQEKNKKRRRKRSSEDKRSRNKKRKKEDPKLGKDVKGILKKRDTPPKCTTMNSVNGTPQAEKNPRSLENLIESPALFDREYIRKATKDELIIACGPTGLLPKKHSERTCKNMRTALEQTREDIIKNIELNKPVLLLKNMGKHIFYRVSVIEVDPEKQSGVLLATSPGGGQVDDSNKRFELRCEWGATGMKKPSKFESDTSLKLQAPKTLTQSKFFATKEEAEAEARKIIKSKDQKRGYYVSMADNLAGVDEHKQVEVSQRKINFAKKAIVQPFYGSEKPKKATKLKTSTAPAKK